MQLQESELFYFRKLLSATVRKGSAGKFYWIGSDSWGAKIHPVRDQEWAAEGAITILPKRNNIEGKKLEKSLDSLIQTTHPRPMTQIQTLFNLVL